MGRIRRDYVCGLDILILENIALKFLLGVFIMFVFNEQCLLNTQYY